MANAASSASQPGAGPSSSSSPPPPPPPPVALPDELVEEILLRFPPGEPASLLRAALVCKRWRRLVSGPGFRRRVGEFHRAPPMLGVFCSGCSRVYRRFEPTAAAFRPRPAERAHRLVLDARHGRVLLRAERRALAVWDPITGEERKVPLPRSPAGYAGPLSWAAAVLCSSTSCDHLDCHHGPFIVVVVRSVWKAGVVETLIFTYSSDSAAWSDPICSHGRPGHVNCQMRSVLVGNALYFGMVNERTALKYDVQLHQMSWIRLPSWVPLRCQITLTTTEDGGLGIAVAIDHESKLYIWSRKDAHEVVATWEQSRVIELKVLLPVDADITFVNVVGSTDDLSIVFMRAGNVIYAVDPKKYERNKVCEGEIFTILPYMSFYTPALEAEDTCEGPSAGGSSA